MAGGVSGPVSRPLTPVRVVVPYPALSQAPDVASATNAPPPPPPPAAMAAAAARRSLWRAISPPLTPGGGGAGGGVSDGEGKEEGTALRGRGPHR